MVHMCGQARRTLGTDTHTHTHTHTHTYTHMNMRTKARIKSSHVKKDWAYVQDAHVACHDVDNNVKDCERQAAKHVDHNDKFL